MPVDVYNRTDLTTKLAHYVLKLTVASRTLYLSTQALYIADDAGNELQVYDGLSPVSWTDQLSLGQTSPSVTSVPMTVLLPDVDWAELVSQGHSLAAAKGELSQHLEGDTWEKRRVLVRGNLLSPVYGAKGEALEFTLKAAPFEDRSQLPAATAVVEIGRAHV